MAVKLTKELLADRLDITRPTLDKYLEEGFPLDLKTDIKEQIMYNGLSQDCGLKRLLLENEIKVCEYKLSKLKETLATLDIAEENENKDKETEVI